jgi:hypothetical protein
MQGQCWKTEQVERAGIALVPPGRPRDTRAALDCVYRTPTPKLVAHPVAIKDVYNHVQLACVGAIVAQGNTANLDGSLERHCAAPPRSVRIAGRGSRRLAQAALSSTGESWRARHAARGQLVLTSCGLSVRDVCSTRSRGRNGARVHVQLMTALAG